MHGVTWMGFWDDRLEMHEDGLVKASFSVWKAASASGVHASLIPFLVNVVRGETTSLIIIPPDKNSDVTELFPW